MPDETTLLADECAAEARAWLGTVAEIASGAAPESAIPLLLLTTSQVQLVGARLGAIADIVLEERFERDPGPDTEMDPLRAGLAQLLDGVDVDETTPGQSPDDAARRRLGALEADDLRTAAREMCRGSRPHAAQTDDDDRLHAYSSQPSCPDAYVAVTCRQHATVEPPAG